MAGPDEPGPADDVPQTECLLGRRSGPGGVTRYAASAVPGTPGAAGGGRHLRAMRATNAGEQTEEDRWRPSQCGAASCRHRPQTQASCPPRPTPLAVPDGTSSAGSPEL